MLPLYEISKAAEKDWDGIVRYTLEKFGNRQVQEYTTSLLRCLDELSQSKGQFKEMIFSGHKVLIKRCQKHSIFALSQTNRPLLVLAIFHEQMDLMKRLKNRL